MAKITSDKIIFEGEVLLEKVPDEYDYEPSIFFVQEGKVVYSLNLSENLRQYAGKSIEIVVREKGLEDEA